MRTWFLVGCLWGVGCDQSRPLPQLDSNVISEGDCEVEIQEGDPLNSTELVYQIDPLIRLQMFDGIGQVITDELTYINLMGEMNFERYFLLDWSTQQVAVVVYPVRDSCEVQLEGWALERKADGGLLFDASFYDDSLNCDVGCGLDTSAVSMIAFDKNDDVSLCRRVRPGCDAP